jgi:hypothetical protein
MVWYLYGQLLTQFLKLFPPIALLLPHGCKMAIGMHVITSTKGTGKFPISSTKRHLLDYL